MTPCVLVTEKEYHKGARIFASAEGVDMHPAPADEEALAGEVRKRGASAVIVGVERYRGSLYAALAEAAGDGEHALIARFGVGYDGIDLGQARTHAILVTNTPGVLDQGVAEHALWLIGAVARHVAAGDAAMRRNRFSAKNGMELAGKTLGVIGFGAIGQRLARMAHLGLGMQILASDLLPLDELAARGGGDPRAVRETTGVETVERDAAGVFERADVVSLHLPALPATEHFVDAGMLARCKPGALLVNTARGSLVDEVALYDALSAGRLAGAALDVFEAEPYQPREPGKDLRSLENVVLTPHVGSSTTEANRRMAQACVANIRAFTEGRMEELSRVEDRGRRQEAGTRRQEAVMAVRNVKELTVYEKAYRQAMAYFELSKRFPPEERYALTGQGRRSSRSVCQNLREAWAKRRYEAHFVSKLTDCDGENGETDTCWDFALSCGYISAQDHEKMTALNKEVGKMLGSMIAHPEKFLLTPDS